MADFGVLQGQPNFFQTALLGLQAGQKVAEQNRLDAAMQGVDLARPETILPVLKLDPQTGMGLLKAHDTQVAADRESAGRTAFSNYLLSRFSPSKGGDPASTVTAPTLPMASPSGAVTTPGADAPPSAMIPAAATGAVAPPALPGSAPAMSVDTLRPLFMAQESSGNYSAVNKDTGALGAYQVMPDTARALARRVGLAWQPGLMTGTSPTAKEYQDKIGGAAIQDAIDNSGGDPHTAFSYYYGGSDRSKWGPQTRRYAGEMMDRLGGAQPQAPTTPSGQPLTMETAPVIPQLSDEAKALIQADPDLYLKTQASLAQIDETRLRAVGDAAEAQGAVAAAIKDQNIPYAQRRAFIQAQLPYLSQHGVTAEMVAGFDPTDANVNAQLVEALGVKGWQTAKNTEADNARADKAAALTERNVTSEIASRAARDQRETTRFNERPEATTGKISGAFPTPGSKAEYDALPHGAHYYRKGSLRIKS